MEHTSGVTKEFAAQAEFLKANASFIRMLPRDHPFFDVLGNVAKQYLEEDEKTRRKKTRISVSRLLSQDNQSYFKMTYPEFEYEFKGSTNGSHSVACVSRAIETELLHRMIPRNASIVDIGGNYVAHMRKGRLVHCCCPILDPRDAYRENVRRRDIEDMTTWKHGPNSGISQVLTRYATGNRNEVVCHDRWEDCDTRSEYAMAVHSLYDISPETLVKSMARKGVKFLHACMHFSLDMFVKEEGRLSIIGCRWKVIVEDGVEKIDFFFEDDSNLHYTHNRKDLLTYFSKSVYSVGNNKYVVSEITDRRGDTYFLTFNVVEGVFPNGMHRQRHTLWADKFSQETVTVKVWDWIDNDVKSRYITVKKEFLNVVMAYLARQKENQISKDLIANYLVTVNNRLIVNGIMVSKSKGLEDAKDINALATLLFVYCFVERRNQRSVERALKEKLREVEPTSLLQRVLNLGKSLINGGKATTKTVVRLAWKAAGGALLETLIDKMFPEEETEEVFVFDNPIEYLDFESAIKKSKWFKDPRLEDHDVNFREKTREEELEEEVDELKKRVELLELELKKREDAEEYFEAKEDHVTDDVMPSLEEVFPGMNEDVFLKNPQVEKLLPHMKVTVPAAMEKTGFYFEVNDKKTRSAAVEEYAKYVGFAHCATMSVLTAKYRQVASGKMSKERMYSTDIDLTALYDCEVDRWVSQRPVDEHQWGLADDGKVVLLQHDGSKVITNRPVKNFIVNKDTILANNIIIYGVLGGKDLRFVDSVKVPIRLVDGVPGCGKSHSIVESFDLKNDLIVTTGKSACEDLRERVMERLKCDSDLSHSIRTADSVLMHGLRGEKFKRLHFDEALMVHPGVVYYIAALCGCKEVICQGDRQQIPFIVRTPQLVRKVVHTKLEFSSIDEKNVTYRNPADVGFFLTQFYKPRVVRASGGNPLRSISSKVFKLKTDIPVNGKYQYLTYTQAEKKDLKDYLGSNGLSSDVKTVHEVQGNTYRSVVLVRFDKSSNRLYNSVPHQIVAASRHRAEFFYYSIVEDSLHARLTDVIGKSDAALKVHLIGDTK